MQFKISKELVEGIKYAIETDDVGFIQASLEDLHATDINEILYSLEAKEAKYVIDLLDDELVAEVISELDKEMRTKFLKSLSSEEIASVINHIDSDDAADILNELNLRIREEVIGFLKDKEKADHITDLLRYDDDVAGGLMAKELIKANLNWTVVQCIEEIRRQAERVEKIYSIYVVDNNDVLLGRVSVKKVLLASDKTTISEIYEEDLVYVESYKPQEDVVTIMRKYDLEAVPVVNIQKKLLGRITIDDVVDVIAEQAELERQMMAGISQRADQRRFRVLNLTMARLPWLMIGMGGGLMGAQVIGIFDQDLAQIPAMAFFIPLITATGGNVGIQSSSLVVQRLANRSTFRDPLFHSFLVTLINGIAISGIVLLFNLLFSSNQNLSYVVSIALFTVVMLSSFVGTITPIILDKFNVNPALASGPFITTFNDLLGIAVYFTVAHFLILS